MITAYLNATHELLQDLAAVYPGYIKIEEVLATSSSTFISLVRFSCKDLPAKLDGKIVTFTMGRDKIAIFQQESM